MAEAGAAGARVVDVVGQDLLQAFLHLLGAEHVDVRGEGGEGDGEQVGDAIHPEDGGGGEEEPGDGTLAAQAGQVVRLSSEQGEHGEEGGPADEGDNDDQSGDLGCAQLFLVLEKLIHARGSTAHSARKSSRRLQ